VGDGILQEISVVDLAGRVVASLSPEAVGTSGTGMMELDLSRMGGGIPSGVYLVSLKASNGAHTARLVLID
jgi:hypothetical protein